ncbi:MAG: DUF4197 domain-containing protein [Candidatus Dadabacteria bacterium]|nr:MAG: DUF4197 domain-containing protein [Candidatus Dadabacteria bacterium]
MGIAKRGWVLGAVGVGFLAAAGWAGAGWLDTLKGAVEKAVPDRATETGAEGAGAQLSPDEIAAGLKEALAKGARAAVERASQAGGFLENPKIRIPLPDRLQTAASVARRFGLGGQADAFEETLNRAAERAAAEALPVFSDAVTSLTFEDVHAIWKGGDTAATDYLRKTTREDLYAKFLPVVKTASEEVGVTRAYKGFAGRPEIASYVAGSDLDLDHYVTDKALDGLFTLVAEEEQKIRTNPVARTTDLLKKVFGGQP